MTFKMGLRNIFFRNKSICINGKCYKLFMRDDSDSLWNQKTLYVMLDGHCQCIDNTNYKIYQLNHWCIVLKTLVMRIVTTIS